MTRKPVIQYELIGGPEDGRMADWLTDEPPREGTVIELPPNENGVRSVYQFRGVAWGYLKSWSE